jgi:cytochrome c556
MDGNAFRRRRDFVTLAAGTRCKIRGYVMTSGIRTAIAAAFLAAAALPPALAQETKPEDAVKYREAIMHIVGGHTGGFFAVLQGKVPHKDALAYHANGLAAATKHIKPAFAQNTTGEKSKAKDSIWAEGSDFNKLADDAEKAATQLASAVAAGDQAAIGTAARAVGGACKACHDKYQAE